MRRIREELNKEVKISMSGFLFVVAYTVAVVALVMNLPSSFGLISKFLSIISPFIMGFAFAFLINIPMTFFEKKVFGFLERKNSRIWNRIKRMVCFLISVAIIYLVIVFLGTFIYGEIYKSVTEFSKNLPGYAQHMQKVLGSFFDNISPEGFIGDFFSNINWVSLAEKTGAALAKISPDILNITLGVTNAVFNFVMSLIFAIYLLFGKERLISQVKRVLRAYFKSKTVVKLRYITAVIDTTFTKFTVGQLTETIILGTLYFAGTSLAGMPYPALIAVLMAIGGIIPVVGPLVTTVPSVLIVLMAGGFNQALWFVVMAIVIQQVESNIIYPKVIGESVGLPGIWVLLAVLAGGSAGGMIGMIVSVPAASVIYKLLRKDVNRRLKLKKPVKQPKEEKARAESES